MRPVRRSARKGILGRIERELRRLATHAPDTRAVPELDKQLRVLEGRLSRLEDAMLDGTVSKDRYRLKAAEIEGERRALLAQRERAHVDASMEQERMTRLMAMSREMLTPQNFGERLAKAPKPMVRELVEGWLTGPIVVKDRREQGDVLVTLHVKRPTAIYDGIRKVAPSASGAC